MTVLISPFKNSVVNELDNDAGSFQENPLCTKNNREDKILLKMETPFSGKSGGRNRFGRKERRLREEAD